MHRSGPFLEGPCTFPCVLGGVMYGDAVFFRSLVGQLPRGWNPAGGTHEGIGGQRNGFMEGHSGGIGGIANNGGKGGGNGEG